MMRDFLKNTKILALIAFALALGTLFLIWQTFSPQKTSSALQTARVTKGNLLVTVSASGSIISGANTTVTTQSSGTITHVFVSQGQHVARGDKLADVTLDALGIQNRNQLLSKYLAAKVALDSAKAKQYALQAQMFADNQTFMNGAVANRLPQNNPTYAQQYAQWRSSESSYKNQQTAIQQAKSDVAIAWQNYQNATDAITAPASGTVTGLKITQGMSISGSLNAAPLGIATIQSAKQAYGEFMVSEMDMSNLRVGQKALISIPAIPGKVFKGNVSAIDTTGIAKSGVVHYPITITLDAPTADLLTNMSADVKIILSEKDNVLMVPVSAIQDNNGKSVVQVLRNGTPTQIVVQTGLSNATQTEILSGLSINDTVVTGLQPNQLPQNGSASPFGGLSNPGNLAAPGGGN